MGALAPISSTFWPAGPLGFPKGILMAFRPFGGLQPAFSTISTPPNPTYVEPPFPPIPQYPHSIHFSFAPTLQLVIPRILPSPQMTLILTLSFPLFTTIFGPRPNVPDREQAAQQPPNSEGIRAAKPPILQEKGAKHPISRPADFRRESVAHRATDFGSIWTHIRALCPIVPFRAI